MNSSHTGSRSNAVAVEQINLGQSIFGEDFLKVSIYPDGEFVLTMCKGLQVQSLTVTKKQLLDIAKRFRKFAHHLTDEQQDVKP